MKQRNTGPRVRGEDRVNLMRMVVELYDDPQNDMRAVAARLNITYTMVRRLLIESRTTIRPAGGWGVSR